MKYFILSLIKKTDIIYFKLKTKGTLDVQSGPYKKYRVKLNIFG